MRTFTQGRRTSFRERAVIRGLDPVLVIDLLQNGKAALAGVVAWVIATDVLGLDQPFLAPWSAVLVVHATVYRAVSRGGQQVAATFGGVILAWACGELLGSGALGMGAMLVIAFLMGRHRWLHDESTTIATTGIVVLTTGALAQSNLLTSRLIDTTVGVAVGLLVTLLVWPPLRDRAAWASTAQLPQHLAHILTAMAAGVRPELQPSDAEAWVGDLRRLDQRIDEAWRLLGQARESGRLNPRRSRPAGLDDLMRTLHLLEQAAADTLSMARTMATSAENATLWEGAFRSVWKELLEETSRAARDQDEELLRAVRSRLGNVARELSTDSLAGSAWLEYGGLLVNLRNVVSALSQVTAWRKGSASSPRRSRRQRLRLRHRPAGYSPPDDDTTQRPTP